MSADQDPTNWNSMPPTGDEMSRLLVSMKQNVLERAMAEPHTAVTSTRRRRLFGTTFGVVALVAVGATSGGIALGMIPSPFEATSAETPATVASSPVVVTPTETAPSASRDAEPVVVTPTPALPIDCPTLSDRIGVPSLLRAPTLDTGSTVHPTWAMQAQAGVRTCTWSSENAATGAYAMFTIDVSPDLAAGRDSVADSLAQGGVPMGAGRASELDCPTGSNSCSGSVVADSFWASIQLELSGSRDLALADHVTSAARAFVEAANGTEPAAAWRMPSTRWSDVTTCDALADTAQLGPLFGMPTFGSPYEATHDSGSPVERSVAGGLDCLWTGPEEATGSAFGTQRQLSITVVPGGEWAYDVYSENVTNGGVTTAPTPISVAGADDANLRCLKDYDTECWIDLKSDHSWLRVGSMGGFSAAQAPVLVSVAELVLARQAGGVR